MWRYLVALSMLLSLSNASAQLLACDVDSSGRVDSIDVQLIINAVLGLPVAVRCDTDWDGTASATDVQLVINVVLGVPMDTDADGLANVAESNIGTNPLLPDTDNDGCSDGLEVIVYGTNPLLADSDNDGVLDGDEVNDGTDPLDANSNNNPSDPGDPSDPNDPGDPGDPGNPGDPGEEEPPVTDPDGDGLTNEEESTLGTNPQVADTDGDGLSDGDEVNTYHTNPLVQDSDGDGLSDGLEVNVYYSDPNDVDTDDDGLRDGVEASIGTNPLLTDTDGDSLSDQLEVSDIKSDPLQPDTDRDGLNDGDEVNIHGTNPLDADTDGDGLSDSAELQLGTNPLLADSDQDGLSDAMEVNVTATNPLDSDSDNDALSDGDEVMTYGTDPLDDDSDDDGLLDGEEISTIGSNPLEPDSDGDGLSDNAEVNTYGTNPLDADTDHDGLTDSEELTTTNTDPLDADSDDDGLTDGDEINTYGTDPNQADTDGDGLTDKDEVNTIGSDPNKMDTDNDGIDDGTEVNNATDPLTHDGRLVILNEFVASNTIGLTDTHGDYSDWIELYNSSQYTFDLAGWALSDDEAEPNKWVFPSVLLAPNAFLVVFASGKDIPGPGELHTNFKLSADGECLALYNELGDLLPSSFTPTFPEQVPNTSYGRAQDGSGWMYFDTPTPGAPNGSDGGPLASPPRFSRNGGTFSAAFSLELTADEPGAAIHYTTDGSEPTAASPEYNMPIAITQTTPVRARVYVPGMATSPLRAEYYLAVDPTLAAFDSNLPIAVLVYDPTQPAAPNGMGTSYAAFIEPDETGRTSIMDAPTHVLRGGIKVRGSSSSGEWFPKKQYSYEIWDETNQDQDEALLGLPTESDWVLHAPYSDKSLMRNYLTYGWTNEIGRYGPRCQYFELFLAMSTGPSTYESNYVGVYILMDKIKVGKNRVDIARLDPNDISEPDVTGGYIFKQDRADAESPAVYLDSGRFYVNHDPEFSELAPEQRDYLTGFLNDFDTLLFSGTATKDELAQYADLQSHVDYRCIFEMVKNIDANSTYFYKDRNKPFEWGPPWDYNWGFGIYPSPFAQQYELWTIDAFAGLELWAAWNTWIVTLFDHPDVRQLWADRWTELRESVLSTDALFADVDATAALLAEAEARDRVKWPLDPALYGTFMVFPTFQEDCDYLKSFLQGRTAWMDSQFPAKPTFSSQDTYVSSGHTVTITDPNLDSEIYYTLDGTDPRVEGGGIHPDAQLYTGPIFITRPLHLVARARPLSGEGPWSAPAVATFALNTDVIDNIRVSEVMYNYGDLDFIELTNIGTSAVQLDFASFNQGISFTFTATTLAPGEFAVLVEDIAAFQAHYGLGPRILGQYTGDLSNSSERIALLDAIGASVQDFTYTDAWYAATDGAGYSLTILDPAAADLGVWDTATGWRPSSVPGGTPGEDDTPTAPQENAIVINEVLAHSHAAAPDWIELYNTTGAPIDISGWFLSDNEAEPTRYEIPAGTIVPANGYCVFYEDESFGTSAANTPFALSENGETVVLSSDNGYFEKESFDASETGVAFGRYQKSTGTYNFVSMSANTPGAANAYPKVGPIVINEIMYNPDVQDDEFIELLNISGTTVSFTDTSGIPWRFTDGIDFAFPAGSTLAPGEIGLLAKDPDALMMTYPGIPNGVTIFGPYTGRLSNSGEKLDLSMPGEVDSTGVQQYIRVDRINYSDTAPWPTVVDGQGQSLSRITPQDYGNDPVNWTAATPTPGH